MSRRILETHVQPLNRQKQEVEQEIVSEVTPRTEKLNTKCFICYITIIIKIIQFNSKDYFAAVRQVLPLFSDTVTVGMYKKFK